MNNITQKTIFDYMKIEILGDLGNYSQLNSNKNNYVYIFST